MNLPTRLFILIAVFAVVSSAIVAQRWALQREDRSPRSLVVYTVVPRPLGPVGELQSPETALSIRADEALANASDEARFLVAAPQWLPRGFRLQNVTVSGRSRNLVTLVYGDGTGTFTIHERTGRRTVHTNTAFPIKPLSVRRADAFSVVETREFMVYRRASPPRYYDLIMERLFLLSRDQALRVLISLPSR